MYEKKLCTYPRTDSRYLTADMEGTVPALTAAAAKICGVAVPDTVLAAQVCNLSLIHIYIQSVDQVSAIKTIKRKITDLDRAKIEEQKKAVRSGYDMDIIPSDLATYGTEAKKLLQDLQSRNERMFLLTFLVLNRCV